MPTSITYSSPNDFWIQNGAIRFELNALGDPDKVAVSLAAGAVIMAWKQGVIDYNAGLNYRTWALGASPTHFDRNEKVYVYVRLSKVGDTAQLVYPYEKIPLDPALYYDESDESDAPGYDLNYYYVLLGALTPSLVGGETTNRYWSDEQGEEFSTGILDTDEYRRDQSEGILSQMFVLNETTNTIETQKDLTFIAGKRLLLLRMRVLGSENDNAQITAIATSESIPDSGEFTPNDTSLITTAALARYAEYVLGNKFFRKDQDDVDPYTATFGDVHVAAGLERGGGTASSGNLSVDGDAEVGGDATVDGDVTINGHTLLRGEGRMEKDITFGSDGGNDDFEQNTKGCKIYWDGSGWCVEADYMNIHKRLYAKTIQVDEVTHVGGEEILTEASCIADGVIPYSSNGSVIFYRVLFRKKNGEGKTVYNKFRRGDLAYCQVFNVEAGVTSDFQNKYYWRLVLGTSLSPNPELSNDDFSSDEYHYIDLSNISGQYDNGGAIRVDSNAGGTPAAEDPIVQLGYIPQPGDDPTLVSERQGATIVSGGGRYKRAIIMFEGISGFSIPSPRVKLSPSDVKIIANSFDIRTSYGQTYKMPIERGNWSDIPQEGGQQDNYHRCYYYDVAQHNGATWLCTYQPASTSDPEYTTEEPSDTATNWMPYAQKGDQGDNGLNTAVVRIYLRSASAPDSSEKPVGDCTYTFSNGSLTASGTMHGWQTSIPAGTNPCYYRQAYVSSRESTATITSWSDAILLVENGTNGTSPYFADLDNEMDSIACANDGKPLTNQTVSTNVSLYKGTSPLAFTIAVRDDSPSGEAYTNGVTDTTRKMKVTWNNSTGNVQIIIGKNLARNKKLTFCITLTATDGGATITRDLYFVVNCVRDSAIYRLVPSVSEIIKKKDGTYVPTGSTYVTCDVTKNMGGTERTPASSEYTLKYKLNGGTENTFTNTSVMVNQVTSSLELILYVGGNVVDRETIGLVTDGTDGINGKDAASVVLTPSVLLPAANANGATSAAFQQDVPVTMNVGSDDVFVEDVTIDQNSVPSGVTATVVALYEYGGFVVVWGVRVAIANNTAQANYEGVITVTATGTLDSKTYSAVGNLPISANKQGAQGNPGDDAVEIILSPANIILTQSTTKNANDEYPIIYTGAESVVTLNEGGVPKTNFTINSVAGTRCTASLKSGTTNTIQVTALGTDSGGNYYDQAVVTFNVVYGGQTFAQRIAVYANLLGTWKETVEEDTKTAVAQTTYFLYDKDGQRTQVQKTVGEFIQSSSTNEAKLTDTVTDGQGTYIKSSDIKQSVDEISLKVGQSVQSNLLPDPIQKNDTEFTGTGGASATILIFHFANNAEANCENPWKGAGGRILQFAIDSASSSDANVWATPHPSERILLTANKKYTFSVWVYLSDETKFTANTNLAEISLWNTATGSTRTTLNMNNANKGGTAGKFTQYYYTFTPTTNLYFSWIPKFTIKANMSDMHIQYAGAKLEVGEEASNMSFDYSGVIEKELLATGVDIEHKKITLTANQLLCQNNEGDFTAGLDERGNFTLAGVVNNLLLYLTPSNVDNYLYGANGTYTLNPLKLSQYVLCNGVFTTSQGQRGGLILPAIYYDGVEVVKCGEKAYDTDFTLSEYRQMVGKTIYLFSEEAIKFEAEPFFLHKQRIFGTLGNDMRYMNIQSNYDISENVTPYSTWNPANSASYWFLLECKAGQYWGKEFIYWEVSIMYEALTEN